jgi:hypothetical protein
LSAEIELPAHARVCDLQDAAATRLPTDKPTRIVFEGQPMPVQATLQICGLRSSTTVFLSPYAVE